MAIADPSLADKNLHFFIKNCGFQILNIPSLGAWNILDVPVKQQVHVDLRNVGRQMSISIWLEIWGTVRLHEELMFIAQCT